MLGLALALASSAVVADAAVLCANKKGAVKLRASTCRPRETAVDGAAVGIQGPKGDTGDQGPAGTAGAGLVTLAQTAESVALSGSYTAVAATLGADAPPTSGAWYGPISNPSSSTVFIVTAHARTDAASGTLDCQLEQSRNGTPYQGIANATTGASELFVTDAFPAFTVGDTYNFRLSCRVSGGSRSVTSADIGAVASVRSPG
jgi:hypothetical protein